MGESLPLNREEYIDEAVVEIATVLREEFRLSVSEFSIDWRLDHVGDVHFDLKTQGVGTAATQDPQFRMRVALLRRRYEALSAEKWRSRVGERDYVASLSADAFADRMRAKVKRS